MPLSAIASFDYTTAPLVIAHQEQFPAVTHQLQSRARRFARRRGRGDRCRPSRRSACRPSVTGSYSGDAAEFSKSLAGQPWLILAAVDHDLHRARRALRKLHPPVHHPDHAAVGRRRRAAGADAVRASTCRWSALIGIILLMGIVKKNAIMMIDFALEAERRQGMTPARGDRPGVRCCASGRS